MNTLFTNALYTTFTQFMQDPFKRFSARELGRKTQQSHGTILKQLAILEKAQLIRKDTQTLYPTVHANTQNPSFQQMKKNYTITQLTESGLIEKIEKNCTPVSIILFGSCAKGTDTPRSDIDIFVEAPRTAISLETEESLLQRPINLLFEQDIRNLSEDLRTNIINGSILSGFIRGANNEL